MNRSQLSRISTLFPFVKGCQMDSGYPEPAPGCPEGQSCRPKFLSHNAILAFEVIYGSQLVML